MNKTGIKELAELLVEKYGLDKASANKFVEQMFRVLKEGLQQDKNVKIKDLGAFKLTNIAARKSVNVNTGEPIIIEGREKITFTPDSSMRDRVNKPFSQFDTVALNDDVDFSAIDEEYNQEMEEEAESSVAAVQEAEQTPSAVANISEASTTARASEASTTANISEASAAAIASEASTATVSGNVTVPPSVLSEYSSNHEDGEFKKKGIETAATEKDISQTEDEKAGAGNETAIQNNVSVTQEQQLANQQSGTIVRQENEASVLAENDQVGSDSKRHYNDGVEKHQKENVYSETVTLQKEIHRQHKFINRMIALVVVLLVLCGAGWAYMYWQLSTGNTRIKNLETMAVAGKRDQAPTSVSEHRRIYPTQTESGENSRMGATTQKAKNSISTKAGKKKVAEPVQMVKVMEKEKGKPNSQTADGSTENKEQKQAAKAADYNKDVRIRTGAYNIVGISHQVKVRPGQTLSGISRSQLGPGMECYVEAVNAGKKEVKAGETINIPKLKLKKAK